MNIILKTKNVLKSVLLQAVPLRAVFVFCLLMVVSYSAFANNITVSNFTLTGRNTADHYIMVKFDITWENSFRVSTGPSNWDAAWVFAKYRIGSTGEWQHTWLNNTGHINPAGSTISTGLLDPALPFNPTTNPGIGAFIYRDADGTGTFSKTGVQLRWNYGANGVGDNAVIDIDVYAIEQVYVPQGSFSAGSGGTDYSLFYKYPTTTNPYQITGEGAITVGTATGNLYYLSGTYSGDALGPIPSAFPKGYNAFYCMKYEISQQGYVDFLNSLTATQASNRYSTTSTHSRYGISVSSGVYSTSNPFIACNFVSWPDLAAYLDWSGLRPMTELEFEKSCRGTQTAVPNEYAWGTTGIAGSIYTMSNSGENNENIESNYSTTVGNAAYSSTIPTTGSINGPVRVGIFAGNVLNTGRVSSGATYYGIMEMSGNLYERPVTVGRPAGRGFTGSHGNGLLSATGDADALLWPGTDALGTGLRGGRWNGVTTILHVSDRLLAAYTDNVRANNYGGRGVRTAQ
ncbi:MAG: SUMF1/EgtB/PvdO family nonheme iron enzyme [Ignavibacteriae bacterium]|nr:SUMF1/EgtB/PvdO family nonheme iron enzyme [Ignavibacteriota bacterium]